MRRYKNRQGRAAALLAALFLAAAALTGCSGDVNDPARDEQELQAAETPLDAVDYTVTFNGRDYTCDSRGAVATDGKNLVLIKGGVYRLTGQREGQIQVSVAKTERVILILDGLTVNCTDSAALYVRSADKVFIEVPEGSVSTLSDGVVYRFENANETKPNACIYGKEDLIFRGKGTLQVRANYNNGIGCKNDIVMTSGKVVVSAPNNGVKGNTVTVTGTTELEVRGCEDGIKTDGTNPGKGWVLIDGQASVSVSCTDDAVQAVASVTLTAGAHLYYDCEGQIIRCDGVINVSEKSISALH